MKITQTPKNYTDTLNQNHRKEHWGLSRGIKLLDKNFITRVDYREYWSKEGNCYICAWFNGKDDYFSISGKASGYGYHKPSSALNSALSAAGFKFSEHWGGAGDEKLIEALKLVAKKLNRNKKLHEVISYA